MQENIRLTPIGVVHVVGDKKWIQLKTRYADGILGLEGFSHIIVVYWFHQNDTPDRRATLRVHPRGNPAHPLTGVFATHSPRRPNLIALTVCKIQSIVQERIEIEDIDALDGSPVLDLKCYIPHDVNDSEMRMPDWVKP